MSADFDKGDAKAISGAGEAEAAYFEHFRRKYPRQVEGLEKLIQEAAGTGNDSVSVFIADPGNCRADLVSEVAAFNRFLRRYLRYVGYQIGGSRVVKCWANKRSDGDHPVHVVSDIRRNSSYVGNRDGIPEVFVCHRRDIAAICRLKINWAHGGE